MTRALFAGVYMPIVQSYPEYDHVRAIANGVKIEPADSSLVLSLPLDEQNTSTALDHSSYENNGTITGATVVADNKNGFALSFEGAENIDFGDKDVFSIDTTNEFTVAFWMTAEDQTEGYTHPCGKGRAGQYEWYTRYSGKTIMAMVNSSSGAVDSGAATSLDYDNAWHHVAATYSYSGGICTVTLYIDGDLKDSADVTVTYTNGTATLQVGDRHAPRPFIGDINDVRIYGRVLTANEVKDLFFAKKALISKRRR